MARLEEIAAKTNIPLVLHGGTGIPDEDIQAAIRLGIRKINVGTQLGLLMKQGLQREFSQENPDPFRGLRLARQLIEDFVRDRLILFRG